MDGSRFGKPPAARGISSTDHNALPLLFGSFIGIGIEIADRSVFSRVRALAAISAVPAFGLAAVERVYTRSRSAPENTLQQPSGADSLRHSRVSGGTAHTPLYAYTALVRLPDGGCWAGSYSAPAGIRVG